MKIFTSSDDISLSIKGLCSDKQSVGFVPTMGALHAGHLRLVQQAVEENDLTTCSIFVNPLQFNNKEDFLKYPSTLDKDVPMLERAGCDFLFNPDYEQVYKNKEEIRFNLGQLDEVMEGKFRPGHFHGVANVVYRFFEIVQPTRAYFGLKDYQQYLVIKNIVAPYFPGIRIVGVETVREESGLALSSRNMRLSPEAYASAIKVPSLLFEVRELWGQMPVTEIQAWFADQLRHIPYAEPEYLEIAHADTLMPPGPGDTAEELRVFTAFYIDGIRLIDNISLAKYS